MFDLRDAALQQGVHDQQTGPRGGGGEIKRRAEKQTNGFAGAPDDRTLHDLLQGQAQRALFVL